MRQEYQIIPGFAVHSEPGYRHFAALITYVASPFSIILLLIVEVIALSRTWPSRSGEVLEVDFHLFRGIRSRGIRFYKYGYAARLSFL